LSARPTAPNAPYALLSESSRPSTSAVIAVLRCDCGRDRVDRRHRRARVLQVVGRVGDQRLLAEHAQQRHRHKQRREERQQRVVGQRRRVVLHLVGLEALERRLQVRQDERLARAAVLDDPPEQVAVRAGRQSRDPPPKRLPTP
jgi:hypothetical protein